MTGREVAAERDGRLLVGGFLGVVLVPASNHLTGEEQQEGSHHGDGE
jgi:hypothetical protein